MAVNICGFGLTGLYHIAFVAFAATIELKLLQLLFDTLKCYHLSFVVRLDNTVGSEKLFLIF